MKHLRTGAVLALALLGAPCGAQTMIEYGAAASAKAAGGGGKSIGSAAGRIFGRTGEALEASRRSAASAPVRSARSWGSVVRRRAAGPSRATPEAFAKLEPGMTSAQLEALLGPPSFRVLTPLGGDLIELADYTHAGRPLGTVRIVNGRVAEIRPAEPQRAEPQASARN